MDDGAEGDAHGHFDQADVLYVSGQSKNLGARLRMVPMPAYHLPRHNDLRDVRQRLHM